MLFYKSSQVSRVVTILKVGTVCNDASFLLYKHKDDSAQRNCYYIILGHYCKIGLGTLRVFISKKGPVNGKVYSIWDVLFYVRKYSKKTRDK